MKGIGTAKEVLRFYELDFGHLAQLVQSVRLTRERSQVQTL